jgi:hypothetical protein
MLLSIKLLSILRLEIEENFVFKLESGAFQFFPQVDFARKAKEDASVHHMLEEFGFPCLNLRSRNLRYLCRPVRGMPAKEQV